MAEKKSAISYESVMKSLKAREFAPVYVLMGDEPFYIDKICDYIAESVLQPEERDFNQTVLFGADTTAVQIVDQCKGYPAGLLANEIQLKSGDKVLRADSVLYSRDLRPRMIIEYKAPHIPITQKVFDQISVYNLLLHVDFLVVSNGLEHYICKMDYEGKKYVFLEDIPEYSDLLTI